MTKLTKPQQRLLDLIMDHGEWILRGSNLRVARRLQTLGLCKIKTHGTPWVGEWWVYAVPS